MVAGLANFFLCTWYCLYIFPQIISLNVITNTQACVKNDKNIIVLTSLIHIFETFKEDIIRLCGLFQSVFILGVASWAGKVDQWFTNW